MRGPAGRAGVREELFRNPVHPYTKALLAAVPDPDLDRKLDFAALMEGKASDPSAWPAPFRLDGRRARGDAATSGPITWCAPTKTQTSRSSVHDKNAVSPRSLPRCWRAPRPPRGAQAKFIEPPALEAEVKAGKLPPVAKRLPENPLVVNLAAGAQPGQYGGTLNMLIGRSRDVRMLVVYGYARLVGYDQNFNIVPDILESIDVKDDRVFTMKLRKGHRWSDGQPFTHRGLPLLLGRRRQQQGAQPDRPAERPAGRRRGAEGRVPRQADRALQLVEAEPAISCRAGGRLAAVHLPAGALPEAVPQQVQQEGRRGRQRAAQAKRGWAAVHNREDNMYQFDNPELPTLQPWVNTTKPPADRFVVVRNPYFHRVDANGRQLPYIDRVVLSVAEGKLIPAKTGAGESDLQARDIQFNNYTFLKKGEKTQQLPHAAVEDGARRAFRAVSRT